MPTPGADWSALTVALAARAEPAVTLSWHELNELVGGLSASATKHHPQWWHGDRPNTRACGRLGFRSSGSMSAVRSLFGAQRPYW